MDAVAVGQFQADGFVVLRRAFDPGPLSDEIDRSLADGLCSPETTIRFENVAVQYLPMMSERTPVSLSLLDALAEPASRLLGRRVLPMRAKASRYHGDTAWHIDSTLDVPSIGFVAYLETLDRAGGALTVIPGSHRQDGASALRGLELDGGERPQVIDTEPGDVIAFDEHLAHGSVGGVVRRQWRVDFIADPVDDYEEALVRSYFARVYQPDWDGGYEVDRYPSYGAEWRARSTWTARLSALGVFELADAQEDFMRQHRST